MKTIIENPPDHPSYAILNAFAFGNADTLDQATARHIYGCASCQEIVDNALAGQSPTGPYIPKPTMAPGVDLPEELRKQTKYTFIRKIGGGGMGVVYLAEHNLMKRKVAIKLIPPSMIGNPAVRDRFLQEVVSAAALEHPNIVRAYSAEEFGPNMVFEMEYVDGKDLGAIVNNKGPLPVEFAVNYIRQAAQGLQYGMLKSLVHRDIKPSNLLLTRAGSVKVADFGVAKFSRESDEDRDRGITGADDMMGTPDYMAPEQARNAKGADIRADIYSLGCSLHYLLIGEPPFRGKSLADLIFKHREDARPDASLLRTDVPTGLAQYIQRMMAIKVEDRPQSPKEVVDDLAKFAKGAAKPVRPAPRKPETVPNADLPAADFEPVLPAEERKRRIPRWMPASFALVLLSIAGSVIALKYLDGTLVVETENKGDTLVKKTSDSPSIPKSTAPIPDNPKVKSLVKVLAPGLRDNPGTPKPAPQPAVQKPAIPAKVNPVTSEKFIVSKTFPAMKLLRIPAGKFMMGSPVPVSKKFDDETIHEVTLTNDFFLGEHTVTVGQWRVFKKETGYESTQGTNFKQDDDHPVVNKNHDDALAFCAWLSQKDGRKYVLPTEAQWEYACRAGTNTPFWFGDKLNGREANCEGNFPFGTFEKGPFLQGTTKGDKYPPNPFGLYDMHGNVRQWCSDWYGAYPTSALTNPTGPETGLQRVVRGGGWNDFARVCRSACRKSLDPSIRMNRDGFRLCVLIS